MIKVKILNPTLGRNEITFRPFLQLKNHLRDFSIDITDSDDYDFLFIGMADFIDKSVSLQDSINYGLETISNISGDYFLFDGSDSTSFMGSLEVFENSNAIYLFKNQILNDKDLYKNKYSFGKWFFGSGDGLDLSYNISQSTWDRIKLTNINCGRTIFGTGITKYFSNFHKSDNKTVDICAIFQADHPECYDHKVRNDIPYTKHRKGLWETLNTNNYFTNLNMITEKMEFNKYMNVLSNSKICISPFGMGELCFRDYESILMNTIILKPDQSHVLSEPNVFDEGKTYIGCKLDWSDLQEKIDFILSDFKNINDEITTNARNKLQEEYTYDKFCRHYYEIFSQMESVNSEAV